MVKKRRIILKRKVEYIPDTNPAPQIVHTKRFYEFTRVYSEIKDSSAMCGFLREWHEDLFDAFPPWEEQPFCLIALKIQYELVKKDYEKSNVPIPERILQNWKASREFDVEGLTEGIKRLTKISINTEKGVSNSAKKSTSSKKKIIKKTIKKRIILKRKK